MTRVARAREESEAGVVLIIVACAMVVLIGMLAIAIDASYGFVQNRRAQNASDFAAFAAAQQLNNSAACNGTSAPPTMQQIDTIVQTLVDENDAGIGSAWSGQFLDKNGTLITDPVTNKPWTFTASSAPSNTPPAGACGVDLSATPTWKPFFAGIFGIHQLGGFAKGSVAPTATTGPSIGIVALNKSGPHEILGGGTGEFVVSGDIFLNTAVTNQPWTGSYVDPTTMASWAWDDAIDAKTSSNLYVYGTIHSNNGTYNGNPLWPLDTCFSPSVFGDGNPLSSSQQQYQSGDPNAPGSQLPSQQMTCSEYGGSVTIAYDNVDPTVAQIDDPLQAPNAPPNPLNSTTNIACPGSAGTQVFSSAPAADVNGLTTLMPGEYQNHVELTGSATFSDCGNGYPGIYRFDQGLWINPGPGDTVTGNNVVIATQAPYPVAGNVPGSGSGAAFVASPGGGNGAPCLLPTTLTSGPSGHGTPEPETSGSACGGTSPQTNGVIAYGDSTFVPDSTMSGTGNNFSLIVGGALGDQVTLTGPTTGAYAGTNGKPGVVLYQDPATQANYGFDAEAGDAATIAINGVVYNASLTNYGASAPLDYWDGVGGGIPFYAGGTLQTGFGAGWSNGPAQSAGSVTLDGTAIVDDFNTDGLTDITILGEPYTLPGATNLSLIG